MYIQSKMLWIVLQILLKPKTFWSSISVTFDLIDEVEGIAQTPSTDYHLFNYYLGKLIRPFL